MQNYESFYVLNDYYMRISKQLLLLLINFLCRPYQLYFSIVLEINLYKIFLYAWTQ